jgi:hypothetical protein
VAEVENIADWRGKGIVDKIGKLEDVYYDSETDEPVFGSVKEGVFGKHLTFVPLRGATASPDGLKVQVSKEAVKDAPDLKPDTQLDQGTEASIYGHFGLGYAPAQNPSGLRLARR